MLNWIRTLLMTAMVAMLTGLLGCNGGSTDQSTTSSFKGINQTYTLAGGRRLRLSGLTGTYSTATISGVKTTPVSLTRNTMVLGGQSIPYLADQNFIQGGGFMGYADNAVIDDPKPVAGAYNTLIGANFAGQLVITSDHTYTWCQRSSFNNAGGCTDGSTMLSGSIEVLPLRGFKFAGVPGSYAAYRDGSVAALFPIDKLGLNLRALSQTVAAPRGTFSQTLSSTAAHNHLATVTFTGKNHLKIKGVRNFTDSYTYSYANGALSFSSTLCRDGVCTGIYNDQLGLVYLAQVGDILFFKP